MLGAALADHTLLLIGPATNAAGPYAQGKRQLREIQTRVLRQNHRRFVRILHEPELTFTDNLAAGRVLHHISTGIGRVVGPGAEIAAATGTLD